MAKSKIEYGVALTGDYPTVPYGLKFYISVDHDTKGSSRRASYVFARSEAEARRLLDGALNRVGLRGYDGYKYRLEERDLTTRPFAEVLNDGRPI